jgi:hypothetical protein
MGFNNYSKVQSFEEMAAEAENQEVVAEATETPAVETAPEVVAETPTTDDAPKTTEV